MNNKMFENEHFVFNVKYLKACLSDIYDLLISWHQNWTFSNCRSRTLKLLSWKQQLTYHQKEGKKYCLQILEILKGLTGQNIDVFASKLNILNLKKILWKLQQI